MNSSLEQPVSLSSLVYVADNEQAFESLWIVHLCFPINKEVLVASDVARKLGFCWFSAFHNLSASSYLRFKRGQMFQPIRT